MPQVVPILALAISTIAVTISAITAWLTLFRRGQVRMTRPTMIVLLHEGAGLIPKLFVRTLLYCPAHRGAVVENMYAVLRNGNKSTTFAFWSHGEKDLVRGSGLYVGREGVALNHHFVLLSRSATCDFEAGKQVLEIFALQVGDLGPRRLAEAAFSLTEEMANALNLKAAAVWFNWNPQEASYTAEIESNPVT
jgi:hypothetical protein